MAYISSLLHALQIGISTYGVYLCYNSITSLRKYEEKSERAAKWSNTAERQLYKTRVTQASGLAAILLSLLSSLYSLVRRASTTSSNLYGYGIVLSIINLVAAMSAYIHITGFWRRKAKVPFVQGFNDGITRTNQVRQLLCVLAGVWAVDGFLKALGMS